MKHPNFSAIPEINVAFVGGGKGCYDILNLLLSYSPKGLLTHIIGVADSNPQAEGVVFARSQSIYTTNNYNEFLNSEGIDLIIELTGSEEVLHDLQVSKRPATKVLDHLGALFLWEIITIQKEKIELERRILDLDTMAGIGEMSYRLTHELRNPLMIVGGLSRRLMLAEDTSHLMRKRLEHVVGHVRHMEEVICNLCDVVRPLRPLYKLVDLGEFLEKWCHEVKVEARLVHIRVAYRLEKDLPSSFNDPDIFKQALWHLVENAMEAIHSSKGFIHVKAGIYGESLRLIIIDNGCGMESAALSQVMRPFSSTKTGRIGLGLVMCKQIINDHGGDLSIKSVVSGGTTATVTVPFYYSESEIPHRDSN